MYPHVRKAVENGEVLLEWDYSKGAILNFLFQSHLMRPTHGPCPSHPSFLRSLPPLSISPLNPTLRPAHRAPGEGHLREREEEGQNSQLQYRLREGIFFLSFRGTIKAQNAKREIECLWLRVLCYLTTLLP